MHCGYNIAYYFRNLRNLLKEEKKKKTKKTKKTHTEKLDFCICQITGTTPEQTKYYVQGQMWSAFYGFSHCV